jgi:hypothetical protein
MVTTRPGFSGAGGEKKMILVSDKAHEVIKDYFKDKETVSPVRVFLSQGG